MRTIRQIAEALTSIAVSLRRQVEIADKVIAQTEEAVRARVAWEQVEREHMAACERLYRQRVARSEAEEIDGPVRH